MKIPTIKGVVNTHLSIYSPPRILEDELRTLLTFKNPDYETVRRFSPWENTRVEEEVCLVEDFVDYIRIPRGFDFTRLTAPAMREWKRIVWEDDRVEFNVKFPLPLLALNDDQKRIRRMFNRAEKNRLRPFGNYLFVVPTSGGKTIAQAMLAAKTGMRTMVVCKTNLIKKSWEDNLHKLFGIGTKDLGLIQQKTYKIGEHFTLASIATLCKRRLLWQEIFSQIGCLIIDECQLIGAPLIQEVLATCPARYIIGMTATETRRDKKNYLVRAVLGHRILKIHNKQVETQSSLPLGSAREVRTYFRYCDDKGKPVARDMLNFEELIQQMGGDEIRNSQIVEEVHKDWAAGHSVLVVTPRLEHVDTLLKMLRSRGVKDANALTGTTNSNNFYTEKLLDNVMARKCRCVVASTQAIKLGANLNPLDRLHLAIPPSNKEDLEQLVGRIRRKHPGKKDAQLCYYFDFQTPYWLSKYKRVFIPTMRKLKVARYLNLFLA